MKLYIVVFGLLLSIGAVQAQETNAAFNKLSWLQGTWIRTNGKSDRTTTERWQRTTATEWSGIGVTVKGKDTLFVEKLRLIIKNDSIYYVADVKENNGLVFFRFTQLDDKSFTCENPEHDFPTKIQYSYSGTTLRAVISGGRKSIEYLFEKK